MTESVVYKAILESELYRGLFTATGNEHLLCSNGKTEVLLKSPPARGWLHLGVNIF